MRLSKKGVSLHDHTMNCNVKIMQSFPILKGVDTVMTAEAGSDYDGTINTIGVVRFYMADHAGKLYMMALPQTHERISVMLYPI